MKGKGGGARKTKAQKTLILGLVLCALMLGVAVFSQEGFMRVYELEEGLAELVQGNDRLKNENLLLSREITALKTDPFQVERIAREKLKLVRPGEIVYQIVPQTASD